jgi:response regulator NasT
MLILIADDESIIRLGLKSMLEGLGHQVIAATNGREAIRMAERHKPDLAILDVRMPYTDGLQAARAMAAARPLPILILTAFSEQDLIERATDLPIQGYLIKPIQPEELGAAIVVAAKRFAESQALARRTAELEADLAARKLIDRAKGKLMERGMSEEAAYREIQERARRGRQTLAGAAAEVLANNQGIETKRDDVV